MTSRKHKSTVAFAMVLAKQQSSKAQRMTMQQDRRAPLEGETSWARAKEQIFMHVQKSIIVENFSLPPCLCCLRIGTAEYSVSRFRRTLDMIRKTVQRLLFSNLYYCLVGLSFMGNSCFFILDRSFSV